MKKLLYLCRYSRTNVYRFLLIVCMIGVSVSGWGQTVTLAKWALTSTTTTATTVAANTTASAVTLSSGSISYQASPGNIYTASWSTSSSFSALGKYWQVTVTPNSGYQISVSAFAFDGGATSSGPMTADVQYSLNGFSSAGTSILSGAANTNTSTLTTISANANLPIVNTTGTITFRIWGYNASNTGNFRINNISVTGTVTPITSSYTLTVNQATGGTISPTTSTVSSGGSKAFTATPSACYSFTNWTVDGANVGNANPYTVSNVTANHTISAVYTPITSYAITASAGSNGTISPSGTTNVTCSGNQTYTITPAGCYSVSNVTVDGTSQGAITSYTFSSVAATHTISATFAASGTYAITASAGSNGSISPSGTTNVTCGGSQTYTITPNSCYTVSNVTVDGASQGAITSYTFSSVGAVHTISATFAPITYAITASAGSNGSISPSGTTSVNCGANQTYTITPNSCYSVSNVTVDGSSQGAITTYTFTNVTATHTISATFSLDGPYNITATAGANGSISPSGTTSTACGSSPTYTITPNSGYAVQDVEVDGSSVGAVSSYSFSSITSSHTISATFVLTPVAIYLHNFNDGATASPYNTSPTATTGSPTGILDANLSSSSWVSSTGAFTNFTGASGQALVIQPSSGSTSTMTLTFNVATGYECSITSFNFWRQRSSANGPTITSIKINGITAAGAISAPTTGSYVGVSNVANAVSNLTGTVTVVITLTAPTASGTNLRLDEFTLYGEVVPICSTPNALSFTTVPSTVVQDAPMSVQVSAICSASGDVATNLNSGTVTLSTAGHGCGLGGTLTAPFVNGVATFSNLSFDRSTQTATLTTTNTGSGFTLANTTSSNITVTAPSGGTTTNTTIVSENFEGTTQWAVTVGTPVYTGSGGTTGGNYMAVKSFTSPTNKAFAKSYTALNSNSQIESQSTATFANWSGLSGYNYCTFTFQVGSLGTGGSGDGNDTGEDMYIETSTDGGSTWSTLLTYKGYSNFLLPLSSSSPVSLSPGANVIYTPGATSIPTQSAFSVTLPPGTSQFMFRMTATNNRSEENWVIDNLSLVGTTLSAGVMKPLPTAANQTINSCPITNATLSTSTTNTIGSVGYSWSPTTNFTSSSTVTSATPAVNFASGTQTYTVTVTDGDGCTATATNAVTITAPSGTATLPSATITLQEVTCQDANGWTYYADPADPTKWELGIYKNGNNFTASANLTVKTTGSTAYDTKQDATHKKATFTLGRYWNATVATGSIDPTKPIKVRFFYSASDLSTMTSDAAALVSTYGGGTVSAHAVEWFKTTTGTTYDPTNNTVSDVPNKLSYATFTTTQSSMNGIAYTEYSGLTGFSGGTAGIRISPNGLALPVQLLYLNATAIDNSYIKLDWATASEIDNKGFAIERSIDGVVFDSIGWVDGHMNSNSLIEYGMNDKNIIPNAVYYYRLRQVDGDGDADDYSNIVSATILGQKGFIMEPLKPNPATNQVVINVVTDDLQTVHVTVSDMLGREVLTQPWQLGPGLNGTTLDISGLSAGTYTVSVRSENAYFTKKLAVTK